MNVSKWYVDCVGDAGDLCIAYWLRLSWRSLRLTFASSLLFREGTLSTRSCITRDAGPHLDGDTLTWRTEGLDVEMVRRAPAVSASLLDEVVQWRCELPAAEARIRVGDTTVCGRGYAELLTIEGAPWKLPIDELRWGRFTGEHSSAVWIDWRGDHPLTFVSHDGRTAQTASVGDGQVSFDGRSLTLEERQIVRDEPLRNTFDDVPLLSRVLPKRLLDSQECKWRSRGALAGGGSEADRGWCISEVVRFV